METETVTLSLRQLKTLMDSQRHIRACLIREVMQNRGYTDEQEADDIACIREGQGVREEMQWILQQQGFEGRIK